MRNSIPWLGRRRVSAVPAALVLVALLASCARENLPPTLGAIPGQYTATGKSVVVALAVTDESLESLAFSATSSNEALVPELGVEVGGSPHDRTVTITPAPTGTGTAEITLAATDAAGLSAGATFNVRVVDPFGHQYPTLTASDADVEDMFGAAVALSQSPDLPPHVLVGAPGADGVAGSDAGAVYVLRPSGTAMEELAILEASDAGVGDEFGTSLAADADILVVGVPRSDDHGFSSGAAYVFERNGDEWTEVTKLTASDGDMLDNFAHSVAVAGDTIVIGARWEDETDVDAGAAYVFELGASGWEETAKLLALDGGADDRFGWSVATDGTLVIVGAPYHDVVAADAGALYVFGRAGGTWQQVDKLTASDGEALEYYGYSVAMHGARAVVGAYGESDVGPNGGAAYALERSGDTLVEMEKLIAADSAGVDQFGAAVTMHGTTILIGAYRENDQAPNAGAAYVFQLQAGTWQEVLKLYANDGVADDLLGRALAIGPSLIAMGTDYSDGAGDDSGSAYVVVW